MRLYFLRHGEAGSSEEWAGPDEQRPLTKDGITQMRAVARGMRWLDLAIDLVLSSPFTRAHQTATIVAEELSLSVTTATGLASGATADALADVLARHAPTTRVPPETVAYNPPLNERILLVGHEPDFSALISWLIGGAGGATIQLKKGALCRVDLNPDAEQWRWDATHLPGAGALIWLLTPKQLRRLGR
jgi:phosphohistidine phosphatase